MSNTSAKIDVSNNLSGNYNGASTLDANPVNNYTNNGDAEMNSRYVKIKTPVNKV